MKLAEARNKVIQLDVRVKSLRLSLRRVNVNEVVDHYNSIASLLKERQALTQRIRRTEWETELGGTSLAELDTLMAVLSVQLAVLSELENREDLSVEQYKAILTNAELFRQTKDNLDIKYQQTLWETELL